MNKPNPAITTRQLEVSPKGLEAEFFRKLQHLLDVIRILEAGRQVITEDQVTSQPAWGRVIPSEKNQLPHDLAKENAADWLLIGFLRDAIEITGAFVSESLVMANLMLEIQRRSLATVDGGAFLASLQRKYKNLDFPTKINALEGCGLQSALAVPIQALNKARNCVVHSFGDVVERFTTDDAKSELAISLLMAQLVAIHPDGEISVIEPGRILKDEAVKPRLIVHMKRFGLGEHIRFEGAELHAIVITLWQFGAEITNALIQLASRTHEVERARQRSNT